MDGLEATLAAATPGFWAVSEIQGTSGIPFRGEVRSSYKVTIRHFRHADLDGLQANAALITMAPDLAAEVLRLRADNKAVVALNARIIAQGGNSSANIRKLYARIAELEGKK